MSAATFLRRRGPAGWTLRTRLLAALVALLAAVSVVIGVASVVALDRSLLGRLDSQLAAAGGRSRSAFTPYDEDRPGDRGRPDGGPGPGFLLIPGQAEGTLGAEIRDHVVVQAAVLGSTGRGVPVAAAADSALRQVPVDGRPHAIDLDGGLGAYRLLAARSPDGDVVVTGLPLGPVRSTVLQLAGVVVVVSILGLLAAALAGAAIVRHTLAPLRRVARTARRVADLPLDRGDVALAERVPAGDTDPRTEVGQVGAAFNHMLEHVAGALAVRQASETRVRHFVADASHELRTPLASIRGYAELTRRSRAAAPPDVAHALDRVESEAIRMTTMVEDLLLLARLDAGRPVERAPVDLSRLLVDALSDAHAAGPQHRWHLDLPEEAVLVTGDAARLHQAVGNLLANARTHTPPGSHVAVTLHAEAAPGAGHAVLRVTDDGPGIPPGLLPEVFERFARGDSSRSRAAGSTGLGLAIVAAVVDAHGGTVEVTSVPGRTQFTVRLPLHPDAQAAYADDPRPAQVPA